MILEDIVESNAIELGHIFNQLNLTTADKEYISNFLVKVSESVHGYNKKIRKLKNYLLQIPGHEEFVKNLKEITPPPSSEWQRYLPIYLTPKEHKLRATYLRIKLSAKDVHYGLLVPILFEKQVNILNIHAPYLIGEYTNLYTLVKPFGYDFPQILNELGILFRLCDITNPNYTCVKNGTPTPINYLGNMYSPVSDKEYTSAYKKFILNR